MKITKANLMMALGEKSVGCLGTMNVFKEMCQSIC